MTRRDAMRHALEEVYAGDQLVEAGAVLDKLDDVGFAVVPKVMPAHKNSRAA